MDRHPTEWYGKNWCYTSDPCPGAIKVPNSDVSVKFCEPGGNDTILGDMEPEELLALGKKEWVYDVSLMMRHSYPLFRTWFWEDRAAHQEELQAIKNSGVATIFIENSTGQRHMVVKGEKVW